MEGKTQKEKLMEFFKNRIDLKFASNNHPETIKEIIYYLFCSGYEYQDNDFLIWDKDTKWFINENGWPVMEQTVVILKEEIEITVQLTHCSKWYFYIMGVDTVSKVV